MNIANLRVQDISIMKSTLLSLRKPDALDTWEVLCHERRLAYENNNRAEVEAINNELIQLRYKNGWTEMEVNEEFAMYDEVLKQPFAQPSGNPGIKYDLNDEQGRPCGLSLSLSQVGQYWKYRQIGLTHIVALLKATIQSRC